MSAIGRALAAVRLEGKGDWSGRWRNAAAATVFAIVLCIGFFGPLQDLEDEVDALGQQEYRLKMDYLAKKTVAINLDLYRRQLNEMEKMFGGTLKMLPSKAKIQEAMTDIASAATAHRLRIDVIRPAPSESAREFYAEQVIGLRVAGPFHSLAEFMSDVANLDRLITINDVKISRSGDGLLSLESNARTFRYLDDEEIIAQRKAMLAAKKGRVAKK